ncbi:class I SAM-dependent methyltransferase [Nocardia sp. BMG51109]|uniref:class I SAM-dependent methyltransferase n=1 Tax=Nocardia sp. BMG51109 TaxID=1056816 RepID=UPI000466AAFE|nr:class I SAM-dependent methyltransferase [Nocardia sp. BMG51109]
MTGTTRYDGDTWDLASSVGATATGVAASRALATNQREPLIHDPYADPLVKAVGLDNFNRMADGDLQIEDDQGGLVLDQREMCEQIAVRTRYFDDFFTDATTAGVRQAVILASGLDTRAYRLPWPAETVVFELDQPEVIEFKTTTLAGIGAEPAAGHRTIGIDLRQDWPTALTDNGFDPTRPTAWIAEGLLIYLPPEAQDRLLDNITALSAPGSRLATEHMDIDAADELTKRLDELSHRSGFGINITELFYLDDRTSPADHLRAGGWDVTVRSGQEAYAANGFDLPERVDVLGQGFGYLYATSA